MRGVAALAVLCLHLANLFSLSYVPPLAHLSVDFFFLLSGFVIAHAYDPRLRGALSPVEFFKLRVVRLYPMILVGASFGALTLLGRRVVSHDLGLGPDSWRSCRASCCFRRRFYWRSAPWPSP